MPDIIEPQLRVTIHKLLQEQNLAVLATSLNGHPYTTLVALASSEDLTQLYFATTRETRKYANMTNDQRVSLLLDNRTNKAEDFRQAFALTALGSVLELIDDDKQEALERYLRRHPSLRPFATSPSCALFQVVVHRYILVQRFQDVIEVQLKS